MAATAGPTPGPPTSGPPTSGPPPGGRPYALRIDARPPEGVSRWLWLVKWLLLVPHGIVLAFLWLAYLVLWPVVLVVVLITGRYPRGIFEFQVGVLRWTWRAAYYGYSALATDQYPPFTLQDVPTYPTSLTVAYPERLSRGLALVKWWLLAIPHYIVVALLTGPQTRWVEDDGVRYQTQTGLIGILVLVAAIILLVAGRYPRGLYDLVMGLNRWVYRVGVYASLMTDEYPPFRLDMGATDTDTGRG